MTSSSVAKDVKMAVNGPVFFLIQEQAKSIVAIQELQSRMTVLEGLQGRLMQAIQDIQQHLAPSETNSPNSCASASAAHAKASSKVSNFSKLRFIDSSGSKSRSLTNHIGTKRNAQTKKCGSKTDSLDKDNGVKSESFNKDSGIGASDTSLVTSETTTKDDDDELLQLLDLIDQKSLVLLQQVGGVVKDAERSVPTMDDQSGDILLDNLLFEKVDAQRQLSEVKAERDELRRRLAKLELATEAVTKEKRKVQEKLEATLLENQNLQEKIQNATEPKPKNDSLGYMEDIERANVKKKYLQYSEKSRRRVSTVLKERNVLELQKQLLTYIMENDVLRAKLQQDQPSRLANWLKVESRLKRELKEAHEDKKCFQQILESKDSEIASLKDRINVLEDIVENEKCVKNFGLGSTDDWREPGVQNAYNKLSNLNAASTYSPLGFGDFSKTQSLPAMLFLDAQAKLKKEQDNEQRNYGPVFDTGSFTDVPLDQSSYGPASHDDSSSRLDAIDDHTKDLVDLSCPGGPNSASALVQSHYMIKSTGFSTPNLAGHRGSPNWGYSNRKADLVGGAKLVNGHLCWKGLDPGRKDISSICTEFDPLSETPSCENFVDSLNLSIPLKPTHVAMSQLSSIGDSLHSASLDLGCASSALYQDSHSKMHNARSVDGIRELNGYYKNGRHLPVNLINCLHDSSDYSLL